MAAVLLSSTGRISWLGRCATCGAGHRADTPAEVVELVERPSDETIDEANEKFGTSDFAARMAWIHAQEPERVERTSRPRPPAAECCGHRVELVEVRGKLTAHECDDRCITATGPRCECSCAGENHGRMFLP